MNSKRGSSAVFLSVILAALMTITLALIYGVREETIRSRTDSIVNRQAIRSYQNLILMFRKNMDCF